MLYPFLTFPAALVAGMSLSIGLAPDAPRDAPPRAEAPILAPIDRGADDELFEVDGYP